MGLASFYCTGRRWKLGPTIRRAFAVIRPDKIFLAKPGLPAEFGIDSKNVRNFGRINAEFGPKQLCTSGSGLTPKIPGLTVLSKASYCAHADQQESYIQNSFQFWTGHPKIFSGFCQHLSVQESRTPAENPILARIGHAL